MTRKFGQSPFDSGLCVHVRRSSNKLWFIDLENDSLIDGEGEIDPSSYLVRNIKYSPRTKHIAFYYFFYLK